MKYFLTFFFSLVFSFTFSQKFLIEEIPFELTSYNNIKVKSVLNKKNTVFLTFDTGSIDFYLTKEAIKKYLNPKGLKLTMKDISDNSFTIGNMEWHHQQIYPIETTGQGTDGMFGWNMFQNRILEIDYEKKLLKVYSKLPRISRKYQKFEMNIMKEHFSINLDIEENGQKYISQFLFDSGFQKAMMLDSDLLTKLRFPVNELEVFKTTILHNSNNDEIPLKTVKIKKLMLGKVSLENVPAELNTYNKPAGYETNFLGSDVLKRFNIILDFQKNVVYLKPNKYFNEKYFDEKKKS
jgi:hypothetical protein